MSLPRLKADFVVRRGPKVLPLILAALGVVAIGGVLMGEHSLAAEAAGLELQLEAFSPTPGVKEQSEDAAIGKEARAISQRLQTPWAGVLDDLEAASRDSGDAIAILSLQPDRDTHRVTLIAEARSLPVALNYLQRLQRSKSLQHPLLDSHEVRTDSAERPVRVQITAEWKLPS